MGADNQLKKGFRLGEFEVRPLEGVVVNGDEARHLQPKSMKVLLCLAASAGEVVERDQLLREVWGERAVTDEPLTRCVSELRRALGDSRDNPRYLRTIPKVGYSLIASVELPAAPEPEQPLLEVAPDVMTPAGQPAAIQMRFLAIPLLILMGLLGFIAFSTVETDPRPDVADASIGVLPFENMSDSESNEWLGRGISEDILNYLAKVDGLRVAARTSSFVPELQGMNMRDIGEALDVHYVLEGSVRRGDDKLKVVAQLIDANTGYHLWSETYDRSTADVFAIQGEIAQQVVRELSLVMPEKFAATEDAKPTDSPEAYDYFLQARNLLETPDPRMGYDKAQRFFRRSLDYDPAFGAAYAGLCMALVAQIREDNASQLIGEAEGACQMAARISPDLAMTRVARGELLLILNENEASLAEFQWVVERYPMDFYARRGLAFAYESLAETRKALRAYTQAAEVAPNVASIRISHGAYLFALGRYEESLEQFDAAVDIDPTFVTAYNNLGAAHSMLGNFEQAVLDYREALERQPNALTYSNIGTNYYYLHQYADAATMYEQAALLQPTNYYWWGNLGDALAQLPDREADATAAYLKAIELADQELLIDPDGQEAISSRAHFCASVGDETCAREYIARAIKSDTVDVYTWYYAAIVSAQLGEHEQSLLYVEKALEEGFQPVFLHADPLLGALEKEKLLAVLGPDERGE